jgi:hypothetical protein
LDGTLTKHQTKTNLVKHLPKEKRFLGTDVVREFIRIGFLAKHRTNTFHLTRPGWEYCKGFLSPASLKKNRYAKKEGVYHLLAGRFPRTPFFSFLG